MSIINIDSSLFLSYCNFFFRIDTLLSLSFSRTSSIISRDISNLDNIIIINRRIANIVLQVTQITKDNIIIKKNRI